MTPSTAAAPARSTSRSSSDPRSASRAGRRERGGGGVGAGEPDDLVAGGEQLGDDGRADPAGGAGDEDTHGRTSRQTSPAAEPVWTRPVTASNAPARTGRCQFRHHRSRRMSVSDIDYHRAHGPLAARQPRTARPGRPRPLRRARLRAHDRRRDRRPRRRHRAHLLPPLQRQARGAVRRQRRAGGGDGRRRRAGARRRATARRGRRRARRRRGRAARAARPSQSRASGSSRRPRSCRSASCASSPASALVLAAALRERGVGEPDASIAAETGIALFRVGFDRWAEQPSGAAPS